MAQDPLRVACWRFEQISTLLDKSLTSTQRRRMMEQMAKVPVVWPCGREDPIALSTLYHWLKLYQKAPDIQSLLPGGHKSSICAPAIQPEWLQYALALLEESPKRSLFILSLRIKENFGLAKKPSRSSLHRALKLQPRYWKIRKRASGGGGRLRVRFQAALPHEIWHADAKAAFWVCFADGQRQKVQILSLLDDATRFVLRALVVTSESAAAAVRVFRQAAARYGLPDKFYADRGSAYDSEVLRNGLAVLGVHRINTKSRNAAAHGKIEAYHRVLKSWFINELAHQAVLDAEHLQALLDAVISNIYHEHVHRELKRTPREAFRDSVSRRLVSLERLREAFMIQRALVPEKKTAMVRIGGSLFRLPRGLAFERRVKIAIDPEEPGAAYLVVKPGVFEPLEPGMQKAGQRKKDSPKPGGRIEPAGSLSPILEKYRGRSLPQARAGFGLPEVYRAFSEALGREVPATEQEAAAVLEWLARSGPFAPDAFHAALTRCTHRLGKGRALTQIIAALDGLMKKPSTTKQENLL